MVKLKRQVWDWDFKAVNPTDYTVEVNLEISGELFYNAFYKAKKRYKVENPMANLDNVYEFEAPRQYLNVLNAGTKKLLKQCFYEVGQGGLKILNVKLDRAVYKKVGEKWRVFLYYYGNYVKE